MTEADRWRTCSHPELVRTRRPDVLPVLRNGDGHNLIRTITPLMNRPPAIFRCVSCGQVGERAVNGT